MNSILLAILSGFLLSLDTVLLKILLNNFKFNNSSISLQTRGVFLLLIILSIGILGFGLWILALYKVELTSIYWVSSIYYLLVPAFSLLLLKEKISSTQFIGYFVITFGSILASKR